MASMLKWLGLCALLVGILPHAAAATVGRYKITSAEKAACTSDAIRFCAYTYPDEERLLGCMRANRDALSVTCRTTFDAGIRRRRL